VGFAEEGGEGRFDRLIRSPKRDPCGGGRGFEVAMGSAFSIRVTNSEIDKAVRKTQIATYSGDRAERWTGPQGRKGDNKPVLPQQKGGDKNKEHPSEGKKPEKASSFRQSIPVHGESKQPGGRLKARAVRRTSNQGQGKEAAKTKIIARGAHFPVRTERVSAETASNV